MIMVVNILKQVAHRVVWVFVEILISYAGKNRHKFTISILRIILRIISVLRLSGEISTRYR